MHLEGSIFFCFEMDVLVSWSRKIVLVGSPPCRVRLSAAKTNECVYVKSGIIFWAKSIGTGQSEHYSTVMANIMLNAIGDVG